RPDRLRILCDGLRGRPGLVPIGARPASEDELALVHDPALIERVAASAGRACTIFDPDTRTSPGSWEAARIAAGGLIELCEAVCASEVDNGVALVRPPGHHAEYARAMGFSLFTHVPRPAPAAPPRRRGVGRPVIFDWDLPPGNGPHPLFERAPDVLYVSTHQSPYYPGTGAAEEVGEGAGAGRTLNLPFPAGFGDQEFGRAFAEVIVPICRQFAPEFVLVAGGCGCDVRSPLG